MTDETTEPTTPDFEAPEESPVAPAPEFEETPTEPTPEAPAEETPTEPEEPAAF